MYAYKRVYVSAVEDMGSTKSLEVAEASDELARVFNERMPLTRKLHLTNVARTTAHSSAQWNSSADLDKVSSEALLDVCLARVNNPDILTALDLDSLVLATLRRMGLDIFFPNSSEDCCTFLMVANDRKLKEVFSIEFPYLFSEFGCDSLYISVSFKQDPVDSSSGRVALAMSPLPVLAYLRRVSYAFISEAGFSADSIVIPIKRVHCVSLNFQTENTIEGIYVTSEADRERSKTEHVNEPLFVRPLVHSRLDRFDFSVTDIIRMISPKLTSEILIHLLAQK